jgi:uncharacterized protein YyaL (SSP411 family)
MGYFAASYAKAADLLLNPPAEVNIVGAPGSADELHRAALLLDAAYRIVQVLNPARDAARLAALSLPEEPAPAAYLCIGTICSPPVTSAAGLVDTVRQMQTMSGPRQVTPGD